MHFIMVSGLWGDTLASYRIYYEGVDILSNTAGYSESVACLAPARRFYYYFTGFNIPLSSVTSLSRIVRGLRSMCSFQLISLSAA